MVMPNAGGLLRAGLLLAIALIAGQCFEIISPKMSSVLNLDEEVYSLSFLLFACHFSSSMVR